MPPSRFAPLSPWRNLIAKPAQPYSEVPAAPASDTLAGSSIAVSPSFVFARAANPAQLLALPVGEAHTGKLGGKVDVLNLPISAPISDVQVCPSDRHLVAVGGENGSLAVIRYSSQQTQTTAHLKHEAATALLARWHPHAAGIIATASPSAPTVALWDVDANTRDSPATVFEVEVGPKAGGKFVQDLCWTAEGDLLLLALADGTIKAYDPRKSPPVAVRATQAATIGLPKPIKLAQVGKYVLASTLNTSRQRELRVYPLGDFSRPLNVVTLDTASSPLTLTADHDRNLIFLGSRGDVTVRWIELDDAGKFPQGAFGLPPRIAFGSAALLPPYGLDVMRAEIDRLYILTASSSEVVPVGIEVPQRQLIDYHAHLFPDTPDGQAALTAQEWLSGKDAQMRRVSLDPARRAEWQARGGAEECIVSPSAAGSQQPVVSSAPITKTTQSSFTSLTPPPAAEEPHTTKAHGDALPPADVPNIDAPGSLSNSLSDVGLNSVEEPKSNGKVTVPETVQPLRREPAKAERAGSEAVPVQTTRNQPSNGASSDGTAAIPSKGTNLTSWSRNTVGGSTPLLSHFTSVPAIDASVSQSACAFLATPTHVLYPLSGAGGRLAFHEIVRAGRLPEAKDVSWLETGNNISDFTVDPFDSRRVVTLADDTVSMWLLPVSPRLKRTDEGPPHSASLAEYEQTICTQPHKTFSVDPGVGRAPRIAFNPRASDVVLVAGSDGVQIMDLGTGTQSHSLTVATAGEAEWSPSGTHVAFASAVDRKLVIWDVRRGLSSTTAAHSSARPFKTVWIDDTHVVTVGHTAGSMREVKVFSVQTAGEQQDVEVKQTAALSLDASPAVLFPHYDADAQLLYLWAKGERSISSVHVALNAPKPRFGAVPPPLKLLPAFQHGQPQVGVSFLPKLYVDVREVEVGLCFRLSRNNEIQRVSWRVERKRREYFQDDVLVPTPDVEKPVLTAEDWRSGVAVPRPRIVDLCPSDMVALSSAPPPQVTKSTLPKGPTVRSKTDKEREEELMNNVFAKAKKEEEEEELEETAARRRAPADDDWGDDE